MQIQPEAADLNEKQHSYHLRLDQTQEKIWD